MTTKKILEQLEDRAQNLRKEKFQKEKKNEEEDIVEETRKVTDWINDLTEQFNDVSVDLATAKALIDEFTGDVEMVAGYETILEEYNKLKNKLELLEFKKNNLDQALGILSELEPEKRQIEPEAMNPSAREIYNEEIREKIRGLKNNISLLIFNLAEYWRYNRDILLNHYDKATRLHKIEESRASLEKLNAELEDKEQELKDKFFGKGKIKKEIIFLKKEIEKTKRLLSEEQEKINKQKEIFFDILKELQSKFNELEKIIDDPLSDDSKKEKQESIDSSRFLILKKISLAKSPEKISLSNLYTLLEIVGYNKQGYPFQK